MLAPAARIASWTLQAGRAARRTHPPTASAWIGLSLRTLKRVAASRSNYGDRGLQQVWMKRSALPLILGVEACADVPQLQPPEAPAAKRDRPVDGSPGSLGGVSAAA